MFVDELDVHMKAGDGGDGVVRWLHEKGREFMGPAGGDGGNGGNVVVEGVRDSSLLFKYRHVKSFIAENGEDGRKNSEFGKNGDDLIVKLPLGSVVTNCATNEQFEILEEGKQYTILQGGRGGYGNKHFKASTNVTPRESTPGKPGQEADVHIELRVIADVGLVGFPNAGKSSLLNALTETTDSKVGNYEFTTLDPHLGTLYGIVLADIPGIIEGASTGKGLGTKFLRHISRTHVLMHCISLEREDIEEAYTTIRKELEQYDPQLIEKPEWIVLTKTDTTTSETVEKWMTTMKKYSDKVLSVSVIDDTSVKSLSDEITRFFKA